MAAQIERHAVRIVTAHHTRRFLLSLGAVVARSAERLPIARIPEARTRCADLCAVLAAQCIGDPMRHDVIDHCRWGRAACLLTHDAQRMTSQPGITRSTPARVIPAIM